MPRDNRPARRQPRRNVAPPPPPAAADRFQRYFDLVPFLIFGITFLLTILEYIHGYLVWDLEKTMETAENLVAKSPFDRSAHIKLIQMVNNFKKMIADL